MRPICGQNLSSLLISDVKTFLDCFIFPKHQQRNMIFQQCVRSNRHIHFSAVFHCNNINPVFFPDIKLSDCFSYPFFRNLYLKNCMGRIHFHVIKNMVICITDRCPFCHLLFWIDHAVGSISQKEFFLNIAFCSCNYQLRTKKELCKNVNIHEDLAKFYLDVIKEDLHEHWVHDNFNTIFVYNEEKAQEVANKIQTALSEEDFQDTVVLDIIELAENESIDSWKILFKSIYNQRESIRYKLGTPAERKAINRMMKKKNPELLELMADVAEREDAKDVINNVNVVIAQIEHDAYIKMLGAYVESHIQKFLIEALEPIGIFVNNEQCGQDFILSKQGYEDYHVEVKSRWENDQSVEMSSTQFRCAVDMPDRYALISVNMYKFDRSRAEKNNPMEMSEIYDNIKCLDNIGTLEADLRKRADEAFKGGEQDIRLDGSYKVRVPQDVFKAHPLDFNGLLERIKNYFT